MKALLDMARPIAARRWLLGTVTAWVVVAYCVNAPALVPAAAPYGPGAAVAGGVATEPPSTAGSVPSALSTGGLDAPSLVPVLPGLGALPGTITPSGSSRPPSVPGTPTAPASYGPVSGPPASSNAGCPFPVPTSPPVALQPGGILSLLGPGLTLSGPFQGAELASVGLAAPIVPTATPLLALSSPVLNKNAGYLNLVSKQAAAIWSVLLSTPLGKQLADQLGPQAQTGTEQLVDALIPLEQKFGSLPGSGCAAIVGNDLASAGAPLVAAIPPLPPAPNIPNLPQVLAGLAAGQTAQQAFHLHEGASVPVTTVNARSGDGVTPGLVAEVSTLQRAGVPVLLELQDHPRAGTAPGGTAFADFVADAVRAMPGANFVQVDTWAGCEGCAVQIADLVHGLAAADALRAVGQIVGIGLTAGGSGYSTGFWNAFAAAARGYDANLVAFVAANVIPADLSTSEAALTGIEQKVSRLRSALRADRNLPDSTQIFVSALVPTGAAPLDVLVAQIRTATAKLGVGLIAAI